MDTPIIDKSNKYLWNIEVDTIYEIGYFKYLEAVKRINIAGETLKYFPLSDFIYFLKTHPDWDREIINVSASILRKQKLEKLNDR